MKTQIKIVAEICLYGNGPSKAGTGWLATVEGHDGGKPFGTGELEAGRSWTGCVFDAVTEITTAIRCSGRSLDGLGVRIHQAGGGRFAEVAIDDVGYYGDLPWTQDAVVYEISYEDICKAAAETLAGVA